MIRTLARIAIGFVLACIVAGLVMVLFVTTPADLMSVSAEAFPEKAGQTLVWGLLTATHSALFAAAFALIAIGIAEWMSMRNLPYYLIIGVLISLLGFSAQYASEVSGQPTVLNNYALKAFLAAGFFAGLIYWMVSGRFAGWGATDSGTGTSDDAIEPSRRLVTASPAVPPRITVKDPVRSNYDADDSGSSRPQKSSLGQRLNDVRRQRSDLDDNDENNGLTRTRLTEPAANKSLPTKKH